MQISGVGSMANMSGTQKSVFAPTASNGSAGEAAEANRGGRDNDGDSDDMRSQATGKGTKVSTTA